MGRLTVNIPSIVNRHNWMRSYPYWNRFSWDILLQKGSPSTISGAPGYIVSPGPRQAWSSLQQKTNYPGLSAPPTPHCLQLWVRHLFFRHPLIFRHFVLLHDLPTPLGRVSRYISTITYRPVYSPGVITHGQTYVEISFVFSTHHFAGLRISPSIFRVEQFPRHFYPWHFDSRRQYYQTFVKCRSASFLCAGSTHLLQARF